MTLQKFLQIKRYCAPKGSTNFLALLALLAVQCSPPATEVGTAPLRRLSNGEYLRSLEQLFPDQQPLLPPLPEDTIVNGFENAAEAQRPTDVRIARYQSIADLYARGATRDAIAIRAVTGCQEWSTPAQATDCATQFITTFGARVFRRPLTIAERDRFLLRFHSWEASVDFEAAVQLTLSMLLQSPQFLYRPELEPLDQSPGEVTPVTPYALATRLSMLLWESPPDDALLFAASHDQLRTAEQVRTQATRMLADPRARYGYWSFHRQWLGLDRILSDEHAMRTPDVDPLWTPHTQQSAYLETQRFVQNILFETGSFRQLLLSPRAWVNAEMARVYELPPQATSTEWTEVTFPQDQRAGLLTRVAFLAANSHPGGNSPPIRGNSLRLHLLCTPPQSPPPGVDLSQPQPDRGSGPQTTRMLFTARTAPRSCAGCHQSLNGVGFGLENYTASGRFQSTENSLTIDASGELRDTDVDGSFDGAIALSQRLAQSRTVAQCLVQQWVRFALGREPHSTEAILIAQLVERFMQTQGDERAVLTELVSSPAFRYRLVGEGSAP